MRRPFWVALGVGFGAAGAIMVSRWTRRQVQRAKPTSIAREARSGLLDLSRLVAERRRYRAMQIDEIPREQRDAHALLSQLREDSGDR